MAKNRELQKAADEIAKSVGTFSKDYPYEIKKGSNKIGRTQDLAFNSKPGQNVLAHWGANKEYADATQDKNYRKALIKYEAELNSETYKKEQATYNAAYEQYEAKFAAGVHWKENPKPPLPKQPVKPKLPISPLTEKPIKPGALSMAAEGVPLTAQKLEIKSYQNPKEKFVIEVTQTEEILKSVKMSANLDLFTKGKAPATLLNNEGKFDYKLFQSLPADYEDAQNYASQLCHIQTTYLLVNQKIIDGVAVATPKTGKATDADQLRIISVSALDFKGSAAKLLSSPDQEKIAQDLIIGYWRNIFANAQAEAQLQGKKPAEIVSPAGGLGVFLPGEPKDKIVAAWYFSALKQVANEKQFSDVNVFYNPGAHVELFKQVMAGNDSPANVAMIDRECLFFAQERQKAKPDAAVFAVNPSDPKVLRGIYDVGMFWKDGKEGGFVGEEFIASVTTVALGSKGMNPVAFQNDKVKGYELGGSQLAIDTQKIDAIVASLSSVQANIVSPPKVDAPTPVTLPVQPPKAESSTPPPIEAVKTASPVPTVNQPETKEVYTPPSLTEKMQEIKGQVSKSLDAINKLSSEKLSENNRSNLLKALGQLTSDNTLMKIQPKDATFINANLKQLDAIVKNASNAQIPIALTEKQALENRNGAIQRIIANINPIIDKASKQASVQLETKKSPEVAAPPPPLVETKPQAPTNKETPAQPTAVRQSTVAQPQTPVQQVKKDIPSQQKEFDLTQLKNALNDLDVKPHSSLPFQRKNRHDIRSDMIKSLEGITDKKNMESLFECMHAFSRIDLHVTDPIAKKQCMQQIVKKAFPSAETQNDLISMNIGFGVSNDANEKIQARNFLTEYAILLTNTELRNKKGFNSDEPPVHKLINNFNDNACMKMGNVEMAGMKKANQVIEANKLIKKENSSPSIPNKADVQKSSGPPRNNHHALSSSDNKASPKQVSFEEESKNRPH